MELLKNNQPFQTVQGTHNRRDNSNNRSLSD